LAKNKYLYTSKSAKEKYSFMATALRCFTGGITMLFLLLSYSCKKEEPPKEDTAAIAVGSAVLNNVYTSFSRGYYYVSDANGWYNFVTLYRTDNSEIRIIFAEQGEGLRTIAPGDTSIREIRYKDAGQRNYIADSGSVNITSFKVRDGVFIISGGFAFRAKTTPIFLPDSSSFATTIRVTDGGFVNLQSED
jgi:hypothetical protein